MKLTLAVVGAIVAIGIALHLLTSNLSSIASRTAGENPVVTRKASGGRATTDDAPAAPGGWASKPTHEVDQEFHRLRMQAEAGDPDAQRRLAQMYEQCWLYNMSADNFSRMLDGHAESKPENAPYYKALVARFSRYCAGVDGGQQIPLIALKLWFEEAAKRGDVLSKIKLASHDRTAPTEGYEALAGAALSRQDGEALIALDDLISAAQGPVDLGAYGPERGGTYSQYALAIAGCRAGADCQAGSYLMDSLCIATGGCDATNYEEFVKYYLVPPGQVPYIERDIEEIQSKLKILH